MCINQRWITNKYTHKQLFVKCGHCKSCLQEKACHRVSRIKATDTNDNECIIVTLTYNRNSCPYVDRSEAYAFANGQSDSLNVYRDVSYRKVRIDSDYHIGYKCTKERVILDSVDFCSSSDFKYNRDLKYQHGKIGVCFYPDVQRFIARLRLNLKRNFNYEESFKTYCCSEYGSKSKRPHFHLLCYIRKGDFSLFRSAIIASWPFSNLRNFERSVEKAFRASSYVASYVNSGDKFPNFLKDYFKPKHSYSKGFGLGLFVFQLREILERFKRGTLSFNTLITKNGIPSVTSIPIPKYVIHRYFPLFVGYSRIPPSSLVSNIHRVLLGFETKYNQSVAPLYLGDLNFRKAHIRLKNAYLFFKEYFKDFPDSPYHDISSFGYCILHSRIWSLYKSTCLKLNLLNPDIPLQEKYDNLEEIKFKVDHGLMSYPVGFRPEHFRVLNPNDFESVRSRTRVMEISYNDHLKHRAVSNSVYSVANEEL